MRKEKLLHFDFKYAQKSEGPHIVRQLLIVNPSSEYL